VRPPTREDLPLRLAKRGAVTLGASALAVVAVGGYSFGATVASKQVATACVNAKHVPLKLYTGAARCPRGTRAIAWPAPTSSTITVESNPSPSEVDGTWTDTAYCPGGYIVTGGGFSQTPSASPGSPEGPSPSSVVSSQPISNGWSVTFTSGSEPADASAYAICRTG
jgi:hypothetical protein